MAPKKKATGFIKLQIQAGAATPAPPVGPALGQHGVTYGFEVITAVDVGKLTQPFASIAETLT